MKNFIDSGVSKKQWEKGETIFLDAIDKNVRFTKLLATLMPKQKREEITHD